MDNIKVYGVDVDIFYRDSSLVKLVDDLTNEEFIEEAEMQGLVWSLKGFEKACNESEININRINIKILQN